MSNIQDTITQEELAQLQEDVNDALVKYSNVRKGSRDDEQIAMQIELAKEKWESAIKKLREAEKKTVLQSQKVSSERTEGPEAKLNAKENQITGYFTYNPYDATQTLKNAGIDISGYMKNGIINSSSLNSLFNSEAFKNDPNFNKAFEQINNNAKRDISEDGKINKDTNLYQYYQNEAKKRAKAETANNNEDKPTPTKKENEFEGRTAEDLEKELKALRQKVTNLEEKENDPSLTRMERDKISSEIMGINEKIETFSAAKKSAPKTETVEKFSPPPLKSVINDLNGINIQPLEERIVNSLNGNTVDPLTSIVSTELPQPINLSAELNTQKGEYKEERDRLRLDYYNSLNGSRAERKLAKERLKNAGYSNAEIKEIRETHKTFSKIESTNAKLILSTERLEMFKNDVSDGIREEELSGTVSGKTEPIESAQISILKEKETRKNYVKILATLRLGLTPKEKLLIEQAAEKRAEQIKSNYGNGVSTTPDKSNSLQ